METLALTQEYFLCTVGDKGKYSSLDMEKGVCLVAAGVLELLMEDVLCLDEKRLSVQRELPWQKAYLDSLYQFVKRKQPVKVETVVENYSFTFTDKNITQLTADVGNSLVQSGCASLEKGGMFGCKALYLPDAQSRDTVIQKIRAELLEDGELSDDIVALAALLSKSGALSRFFSAYEKKDLKRRLAQIKNSAQNEVVVKMVEYVETLLMMVVIAAT